MFPSDCLNEYWIYKLPDGTRVVAELKEDGFWWLWQYWRMSYGGSTGNYDYDQFVGISRHSHLDVSPDGKIMRGNHEICMVDQLEDTYYILNMRSGTEDPRGKALDELIQMTNRIFDADLSSLDEIVKAKMEVESKKISWWRRLFRRRHDWLRRTRWGYQK